MTRTETKEQKAARMAAIAKTTAAKQAVRAKDIRIGEWTVCKFDLLNYKVEHDHWGEPGYYNTLASAMRAVYHAKLSDNVLSLSPDNRSNLRAILETIKATETKIMQVLADCDLGA